MEDSNQPLAVGQLVVLGGRVGTITQLSGSNVAVSICGRSMWRDRRAVLPLFGTSGTRKTVAEVGDWVKVNVMSQGSNVAPQQQEKVGQVVIARDGRLSIRVWPTADCVWRGIRDVSLPFDDAPKTVVEGGVDAVSLVMPKASDSWGTMPVTSARPPNSPSRTPHAIDVPPVDASSTSNGGPSDGGGNPAVLPRSFGTQMSRASSAESASPGARGSSSIASPRAAVRPASARAYSVTRKPGRSPPSLIPSAGVDVPSLGGAGALPAQPQLESGRANGAAASTHTSAGQWHARRVELPHDKRSFTAPPPACSAACAQVRVDAPLLTRGAAETSPLVTTDSISQQGYDDRRSNEGAVLLDVATPSPQHVTPFPWGSSPQHGPPAGPSSTVHGGLIIAVVLVVLLACSSFALGTLFGLHLARLKDR